MLYTVNEAKKRLDLKTKMLGQVVVRVDGKTAKVIDESTGRVVFAFRGNNALSLAYVIRDAYREELINEMLIGGEDDVEE